MKSNRIPAAEAIEGCCPAINPDAFSWLTFATAQWGFAIPTVWTGQPLRISQQVNCDVDRKLAIKADFGEMLSFERRGHRATVNQERSTQPAVSPVPQQGHGKDCQQDCQQASHCEVSCRNRPFSSAHGIVQTVLGTTASLVYNSDRYFFSLPESRTAINAFCGISTCPTDFIRFFPSRCLAHSFRFLLMSPP